jgi:hypothetical protein
MEAQKYSLHYKFRPGVVSSYRAEGKTTQTFYGAEQIDSPEQAMDLTITFKSLFEDQGGRIHLLLSSMPVRMMVGEREMELPDMKRVYAMVDRQGRILESTDAVNIFIHPFPAEPIPVGHKWEYEESIRPVETMEPLPLNTVYVLEKACDYEGAAQLVISFHSPKIWYKSQVEAMKGSTLTFMRDGIIIFDPELGQITKIDQTSSFTSENDVGRMDLSFQSVMTLGEILEDPTMLPKTDKLQEGQP